MLETPNEKINNLTVKFIKQNYPKIVNETMMQETFEKFIASFNNAYEKAIEKFIRQFADEEGLSFKCAEYHIDIDSYHPLKNECEKELLKASERKIKEKVKGVYDVP